MNKKEMKEIQELLFALLPYWNFKITKPLKQSLETGISMEMYYCIQILRSQKGSIKMNEIAKRMNMSKQQATKLVDKMVENKLAERCFDKEDRRVIKIQETEYTKEFMDYYLNEKIESFYPLISEMNACDRTIFKQSLQNLYDIFTK